MTGNHQALDDLAAGLQAAAAAWNAAVERARASGVYVKLILSGDGASIYDIHHSMISLAPSSPPPKPEG